MHLSFAPEYGSDLKQCRTKIGSGFFLALPPPILYRFTTVFTSTIFPTRNLPSPFLGYSSVRRTTCRNICLHRHSISLPPLFIPNSSFLHFRLHRIEIEIGHGALDDESLDKTRFVITETSKPERRLRYRYRRRYDAYIRYRDDISIVYLCRPKFPFSKGKTRLSVGLSVWILALYTGRYRSEFSNPSFFCYFDSGLRYRRRASPRISLFSSKHRWKDYQHAWILCKVGEGRVENQVSRISSKERWTSWPR